MTTFCFPFVIGSRRRLLHSAPQAAKAHSSGYNWLRAGLGISAQPALLSLHSSIKKPAWQNWLWGMDRATSELLSKATERQGQSRHNGSLHQPGASFRYGGAGRLQNAGQRREGLDPAPFPPPPSFSAVGYSLPASATMP